MVASVWLRGAVRMSSGCGFSGLGRSGSLWSVRPPMLRLQNVRQCFHPGASSLAREGLKFQKNVKKVTGKDMIKALSNYIWPKGLHLFGLLMF